MNDTLNKIIIFAAGFAVGSVVTRMIIKRYETRSYETENEIECAAELDDVNENTNEVESNENLDEGQTMKEYKEELKKHNYIDYSSICGNDSEVKEKGTDEYEIDEYEPSVIAPEELGELEEYDVISLIYYADKILTDDMNEPVDNAEKLIGPDALNHFGEYDDDSVCVRNDKLKCDYEILLDTRRYVDVTRIPRPNQVEE